MAVDVETNQVVAFSLTGPRVHDSKEGIVLVEEAAKASEKEGKRVKKVLADKGHDTHKMFNRLREFGIEAGIVPRLFKEECGGKFFASFKERYGEHVMSRKPESARLEVWVKIWLHKRFSAMRGGR